MKVNFDNLRLNLIKDYNSLVKKLSAAIDGDNEVVINESEIKCELDSMRSLLVTLGCCYAPDAGIKEIEFPSLETFEKLDSSDLLYDVENSSFFKFR